MKLAVFTSITLVAILVAQALGDDENVKDKTESSVKEAKDVYKQEKSKLEKYAKDIKDKAEGNFKDISHNLEEKFESVKSSVRSRRSPQTYPDSGKSPTDEALDNLSEKYDKFKGTVSGLAENITNSEAYGTIKNSFGKLADTFSDVGKKIKSSVHNFTAPESTDSPKESH